MIKIQFTAKDVFTRKTMFNALWIGALATFIEFLLSFFGIDILFGILPGGFKLVIVVAASVILSKTLMVIYNGREVI